jgi:Flp pilus assembly protein TadD
MDRTIFRVSLSQRPRDPEEECRLLRGTVSDALRAQRMERAAALLERLEIADPSEPRWAHQHGDTLVLLGDTDCAVEALRRAAELYRDLGLHARRESVLQRARELADTRAAWRAPTTLRCTPR